MAQNKQLTPAQSESLLKTLQTRFEKNMSRHQGLAWEKVEAKLLSAPQKLWSLHAMEKTGGEPDVLGLKTNTDEYIFCDCSAETPKERRNICYDTEGQREREKKGVHPSGNAVSMAEEMGIELLDERMYRKLQELGEFDTKTSSWILTPADIRKLGGALFADRRFNHVFVYHNTAPTFYSVRAFRGWLSV